MSNTSENKSILKKDGVSYLVPFILITFCFALWGFANDITNPMVKAFSKIFIIRKTKCSGISEQNVPFPKRNVPL